MSKAAKQSIIILVVLLVGCLGFAAFSMLDSQKAKDESARLSQELGQSQDREKKALNDVKSLKDELERLGSEREKLNDKVRKAEKNAEDLNNQIIDLTSDRDKWKSQVDSIGKERDGLVAKIKDLNDQIAKKEEELAKKAAQPQPAQPQQPAMAAMPAMPSSMPSMGTETTSSNNDQYWASVLKDKAALEVKINNLNQELEKKTNEIADLKQSNADFKVKLDGIVHDKEEMENEIKYKSDMVNNLSLELARTKNDKKFVADRVEKINQENSALRGQIKQLVSSKSSLEKSILRITQERNDIERKLGQEETMVQSKINEIWDIKDSLDQSVKDMKPVSNKPSEVELPPIVVSSDGQAVNFNTGMTNPGLNGKVVSVNKDNNFVVVDIGESQNIQVGETLNVYRDSKYIARLAVIQVRKDISAADIKDQWTDIKVGDIIR